MGLHGWYLRDDSEGAAGALGTGVASSLSEMQGGPRLDFRLGPEAEAPPVSAELVWLVADAGYNRGLDRGRLGAGAWAAANLGRLYVTGQPDPGVLGLAAGAEARAKIAAGAGSVARLEGLAVSANGPDVERYSGIVTGNSYGIAGATWASSGALLLFPDVGAINRQAAVASDSAAAGAGRRGGAAGVGYDPGPDRLTLAAGAAAASTPAGRPLGVEVNGRITAHPVYLMDVGLAAATVQNAPLEIDPWAVFGFFQWVVF